MKNIIKTGVILMFFSAVAAGALAAVNMITAPQIEANARQEEQKSYAEVMPEGVQFNDITAEKDEIVQKYPDVRKLVEVLDASGGSAGIIITTAPRGYSSDIVTLVGLDGYGEIVAVKVVSQNETPGLGTHLQDPWFQEQFAGKKQGDDLTVEKDGGDIQAITAATISSRAACAGISQALSLSADWFGNAVNDRR